MIRLLLAALVAFATPVDRLMQAKIPATGPGAILTVAKGGKVLYQRGFGLANVASRQPFTATSVFDLASCSKEFTGAAVLLLAQRRALELGDDVHKYLPEIPAGRRVIDLLHMTSGLPIYTDFMDSLEGVDNVAVARAVGKRKPMFAAGTKYKYNNTDYALLALVVQRVAKKPFAAFMRDEIFTKVGMRHTLVVDHPGARVPGRVQGYSKRKPVQDDTSVVGDGQVFSCAEDLVRWDQALGANTLLKPVTAMEAFTSARLANGKQTDYGIGWNVEGDEVWHDGSWTGTATYVSRNLKNGTCVILLSNDEGLDVTALAGKIEEKL